MKKSAFVGVSLDSSIFSRDWIRFAIPYILSQHDRLEFVLGDKLLAYNKSMRRNGQEKLILDLPGASGKIAKRTNDISLFLKEEVARLPQETQPRVNLSFWNDHADSLFSDILRTLWIAYAGLASFRECVEQDVRTHLLAQIKSPYPTELHAELCAAYVIEETAMIMRITEFGKPYEYYPQKHIQTLTSLYDGDFVDLGLAVAEIVGHPQERLFTPLPPPT